VRAAAIVPAILPFDFTKQFVAARTRGLAFASAIFSQFSILKVSLLTRAFCGLQSHSLRHAPL